MSDQSNDAERTAPKLADRKTELEVRKLEEDLSIWSRIAAIVIPIALFAIGAAQTYIAWSDFKTKGAREQADLDLKQIESGMKLVDFVTNEAGHIRSGDPDDARQTVTYVSALLPADMACQILNALVLQRQAANDLSDYAASMKAQIAQSALPPPPSCLAKPREAQDAALIAIARKAPDAALAPSAKAPADSRLVAPPPPPPTNAASCPAPDASGELAVYYQIVRKEDRSLASQIGYQMPVQFPSAGIEYVSEPQPSQQQPEVRFYYPEQKPQADYLACLLTRAYAETVPGTSVQFKSRSLASQYKNLPTKRVEVWFPPIQPAG